jgi:hypothetical protein
VPLGKRPGGRAFSREEFSLGEMRLIVEAAGNTALLRTWDSLAFAVGSHVRIVPARSTWWLRPGNVRKSWQRSRAATGEPPERFCAVTPGRSFPRRPDITRSWLRAASPRHHTRRYICRRHPTAQMRL